MINANEKHTRAAAPAMKVSHRQVAGDVFAKELLASLLLME